MSSGSHIHYVFRYGALEFTIDSKALYQVLSSQQADRAALVSYPGGFFMHRGAQFAI